MPSNAEVKRLLLDGYAYMEVVDLAGVSPKVVSDTARSLIDQGHTVRKKTPEQVRKSIMRQMHIGYLGNAMEDLSEEELEFLMGMSFDTWADAAVQAIKELYRIKEQPSPD